MDFTKTDNKDKSFNIVATISIEEIKQTKQKVTQELAKSIDIKGFRKGAAPKELAEKEIDPKLITQKTLEEIIRIAYSQAIGKYQLRPIIAPKIEVLKMDDLGWQLRFISCEVPEVNLNSYKDEVAKVAAKGKIWTPEKELKEDPKTRELEKEKKLQTIIEVILKIIKVEIPEVIIDQELTHRLANLIDELQKVGLTVDQYLSSKQKTIDQLKTVYKTEIEANWKLELILNKIAEDEKITVTAEEIQAFLNKYEGDKTKKVPEGNQYLLAKILRQQKTLDFLSNL